MTSDELKALTDAEILEWAKPFLHVTRPPIPVKEDALKELPLGETRSAKPARTKSNGFDSKYNEMLRKAKELAEKSGIKLET